jgi:DNA-binding PadR family transcriptional regulator
VYRITPAGAEVLKRLRASLAELQHEVGVRPSRASRPGAQTSKSGTAASRRSSKC